MAQPDRVPPEAAAIGAARIGAVRIRKAREAIKRRSIADSLPQQGGSRSCNRQRREAS
jgi:hypothetical protein